MTMSQLLDTSSLLTNYMNSKITALLFNKLYGSDATVAMPDSTRRAFTSRMRLDSRVALQGAQNMEDAAAMVTAAQSDITAIKDKLKDMRNIAVEASTLDPLQTPDFETARQNLFGLARDIVSIAEHSSFNGISLLDGKAGMDSNGRIQLQAGNASREQVLTNVLDAAAATNTLEGTSINLKNLESELGGLLTDAALADPDTAAAAFSKARDVLSGVFDRIQGIESQYSYDIKSLTNMSILLQGQADILDGVQQNHQTEASKGDTASGSSSALSDLLGGNIMSAVS